MKILGIRTARSIFLFPTIFLNPRGYSVRGEMDDFRARYKFRKTPDDDPPTKDAPGVKWGNGEFQAKDGLKVIRALTIHDDGVVVDMGSTTEDADAFAHDAVNFLSERTGLPKLEEIPAKRIYLSELNIQLKREPKVFSAATNKVLSSLSKAMGDENCNEVQFMGLVAGLDQSLLKSPVYRFEREVNTKNADNRYFSSAPFPSSTHLEILEMIEKLS